MKFFIALIIAAIPWYPIGFFISETTKNGELAVIITSAISVVIFLISFNKIQTEKSLRSIVSNTISAVKDLKDSIEFGIEEKTAHLYAQAEEEYDNGAIDKELWSQALIKAKGDENLRKVEYMKLRVKRLNKEPNN